MKTIAFNAAPDFERWRDIVRKCLMRGDEPCDITWRTGEGTARDLFETEVHRRGVRRIPLHGYTVPASFLDLAQDVLCHKDDEKYACLYRLLWRLTFETRTLLFQLTDKDVMAAKRMAHEVRRDAYKITAFLRFRQVNHAEEEYFIAWYEPEHYTLERVLPFFTTRFRNMNWSILTPYRAAHWHQGVLQLQDNPDPSLYPKDDEIETYWLGYYASIFNPARIKEKAMLAQMPKKYWKNLPEAVLIPGLLRGAQERVDNMFENGKS